ncbi:MAG: SDR family NAD(P)-dependent oxidoreductase, partial [Rikenellaceae bacterium]|nr:SDR family NAD(P)-dependent oxidoreductase [Rikenellaceae bacterium]
MKKIAFITGASSGIGRDTALLLAGHGYHVFVAARHVEKIPDFPGITPLFIDLTDDRTIVRAVESVLSKHDSIDVLVNDAGYGFYGTLEDV